MEANLTISEIIRSGDKVKTWLIDECIIDGINYIFYDDLLQKILSRSSTTGTEVFKIRYHLDLERFDLAQIEPIDQYGLTSDQLQLYSLCSAGIVTFFGMFRDLTFNRNYPLRIACNNGHIDIIGLLLDLDVDPSDDNNFSIRVACQKGFTEIVEILLKDARIDPTVDSNYPLRAAIAVNNLEIVKLLLADIRIDPSLDDNIAIKLAIKFKHLDIIKCLLSDSRIEIKRMIKLIFKYNFYDIIFTLLDSKKINAETSLTMACQYNNNEVLEKLIHEGNVPSNDDFIIACDNNNFDIVNTLLSLVDTDGQRLIDASVDNNIAIRTTSSKGYTEIVARLLYEDNVDPSADDNYAIKAAIQENFLNVVELLYDDEKFKNDTDTELNDEIAKLLEMVECIICSEPVRVSNLLICKHMVCINCMGKLRHTQCPACRGPLEGPLVTDSMVTLIRINEDEDRAINYRRAARTAELAAQGVNVEEMYTELQQGDI
jgi:ankyrin repeat protein